MQVNILEAKNQLSQLIKAAQAGEEVVIANRGQPVARLIATQRATTAETGSARAILDWLKNHPLPTHSKRNDTEIDADILAERGAWD